MALTPSCVEDFSKEWLLFVMQQYYESHYGENLKSIGEFTVHDNNSNSSNKKNMEGGKHSHHILSEAFKVIVEVPDPPKKHGTSVVPGMAAKRDHNLFVKVPPKRTAKFERMVRRNRTLEHEVKVYTHLLRDLQKFMKNRVGDTIQLKIPDLYHGFTDGNGGDVLVVEDLAKQGFHTRDWFKHKLNHEEVMLAVTELAKFHACGLAYRMSLKEEIDDKYPFLEDDLYTSNMAKELLAKYLDSFLHFLSFLPGIQEHVLKLRKISGDVFQLLVKLRRPMDPLGTRFNTVCHGDMWMGNVMFKDDEDGKPVDCVLIDFHSAQFLSPATDLAHLLLTSTDREYRLKHWDEVVQHYYDTFNRTLAEFGLVLRHLGTTYQDFLYEVKRALRGQFLCVAFIIPIVIYCGPTEWRYERRRGSSVDRKNTVRHLIQMMAITEEQVMASDDDDEEEPTGIPPEFEALFNDEEIKQTLVELIETAADLDILDFQEFCKNIDNPTPMWFKTQATTGKHIPVY